MKKNALLTILFLICSLISVNAQNEEYFTQEFLLLNYPKNSIHTQDFNHDHLSDIAIAINTSDGILFLLNDNQGFINNPTFISAGGWSAKSLSSGDFNNDGNMDLAIGPEGFWHHVLILTGDGNGNFSGGTSVPSSDDAEFLVTGDFNGDGFYDMAAGFNWLGAGFLRIVFGLGQNYYNVQTGGNINSIVVNDFNDDGFDDFIVLHQSSNNASIHFGGNLSSPSVISLSNSPSKLISNDFNNDGNYDLLISSYQNNSISLFQGNGNGTFNSSQVINLSNSPLSIISSDFDIDGNIDFVVGYDNIGILGLYLGNGNGTFQLHSEDSIRIKPEFLTVGYFNNQDTPDLIFGNSISDTLTILYNNIPCLNPILDKIIPSNGANSIIIPVTIHGRGFTNDCEVKLSKIGENDIVVHDSVIEVINCYKININLDIKGQAPGFWDLTVTIPQDTVMTIQDGFEITRPSFNDFSPKKIGNNGQVTINLYGKGFTENSMVFVTNGTDTIYQNNSLKYLVDNTNINSVLNLNNVNNGLYDVIIEIPGDTVMRINDSLLIEDTYKSLWINITGNQSLLSGSESLYAITYGNNGNTDEPNAEIVIWFDKIFTAKLYDQFEDSAIIISPAMIEPTFVQNEVGLTAICPNLPPGIKRKLFLEMSAISNPNSFYDINYRIANDLYFLSDTTSSKMKSTKTKKSNAIVNNKKTKSTFKICSQIWGKLYPLLEIYHPVVYIKEFDQFGNLISETGYTEIADFDPLIQNCNKQWIQSGTPSQLAQFFQNEGYYELTDKKCLSLGDFGLSDPNILIQEYNNNSINNSNSCHIDQPCKDDNNNSYNCWGKHEKIFEIIGVNNGDGIFSQSDENKFFKPISLWIEKFGLNWFKLAYALRYRSSYILEPIASALHNKSGKIDGSFTIEIVNSLDPNYKVGPIGYGVDHYISHLEPIYYIIHFENVDSATASAQYVKLTDTLNTNLNWATLEFDMTSHIPTSQEFDEVTGIIEWIFEDINLPPNVNPPEGEGWVMFHINQLPNLPSSTQITNRASIQFDYNDAMLTPTVLNTIDAGYPSSSMNPIITHLDSTKYLISWSGLDDYLGSGIRDYTIYYSKHPDSTYIEWISNVEDTSAIFTGENHKTYYFYSIARDGVGFIESPPDSFDLAVYINVGVLEYGLHDSNLLMIYPNPFSDKTTIEFNNPNQSNYYMSIYSCTGNKVLELENIRTNKVEIEKGNLSEGIYFIVLKGEKIFYNKMIIVK